MMSGEGSRVFERRVECYYVGCLEHGVKRHKALFGARSRRIIPEDTHAQQFQTVGKPRTHISTADNPHYQIIDRKSTRLNSSHVAISYAVFCLKKQKKRVMSGD